MQNNMFRKGLACGIIVLFIGVAIVPSFNAEVISIDNSDTITEEIKDES